MTMTVVPTGDPILDDFLRAVASDHDRARRERGAMYDIGIDAITKLYQRALSQHQVTPDSVALAASVSTIMVLSNFATGGFTDVAEEMLKKGQIQAETQQVVGAFEEGLQQIIGILSTAVAKAYLDTAGRGDGATS